MGEKWAGNSGAHEPKSAAVETTNGAGPHNIQLFIMAADGTVLHCLPGYWNPRDLAGELDLAVRLNDVYQNASLSGDQKDKLFKQMQLEHIRSHGADMVARSSLQHFDMAHEAHRARKSDVIKNLSLVLEDPEHAPPEAFKTTDQLMHERMASRAFRSYSGFDVGAFVDYGSHMYDKHEANMDEDGRPIVEDARVKLLRAGGGCKGSSCPK